MAKPDFMKEMHKVRKEVLDYQLKDKELGVNDPTCSTVMRAMNIVGAFSKNKSIFTVESGNIDNKNFVAALQSAVNFMRLYGESDVNVRFDEWVMDNLIQDENSIMVMDRRDRVIVL